MQSTTEARAAYFGAMAEQRPCARQAFDAANTFYEAALRCERFVGTDGAASAPIPAAVVNFAFALELYIKALFSVTTHTPARGHNLNALMRRLPPDAAQSIAARYFAGTSRTAAEMYADLAIMAEAFVHGGTSTSGRKPTCRSGC